MLSTAHFPLQKQAAAVVTEGTILRHGSAGGYCYRQHISALRSAAASTRGVVIPGTVPAGGSGTATAGYCCYWQHISGFWLFGWGSSGVLLSVWQPHQAVHGRKKDFSAQDCYSAHSFPPKGACNITVHRHFVFLLTPLLSSAQFFVFLLLFAAHFCAGVGLFPRTDSVSPLSAAVLPRSSPHCTVSMHHPVPHLQKNFIFFPIVIQRTIQKILVTVLPITTVPRYCYSRHISTVPGLASQKSFFRLPIVIQRTIPCKIHFLWCLGVVTHRILLHPAQKGGYFRHNALVIPGTIGLLWTAQYNLYI